MDQTDIKAAIFLCKVASKRYKDAIAHLETAEVWKELGNEAYYARHVKKATIALRHADKAMAQAKRIRSKV